MPLREDDSSFWTSFSDLMTGLFLVTLVLFVLSYHRLKAEEERLRVNAEGYERLKQLDRAIQALNDKQHFKYDPEFKRYVLLKQINFDSASAIIKPEDFDYLRESGEVLSALMQKLREDPASRGIRYLVVIEGMASKDNYKDNFVLSYRRALALAAFWRENNIHFDPQICELLVAGSGTEGIGRSTDERLNQRFLIQVIPKTAFDLSNSGKQLSPEENHAQKN